MQPISASHPLPTCKDWYLVLAGRVCLYWRLFEIACFCFLLHAFHEVGMSTSLFATFSFVVSYSFCKCFRFFIFVVSCPGRYVCCVECWGGCPVYLCSKLSLLPFSIFYFTFVFTVIYLIGFFFRRTPRDPRCPSPFAFIDLYSRPLTISRWVAGSKVRVCGDFGILGRWL